jgi:type IV pilus assembly protein PilA
MLSLKNNKKGFTIIEVLIVLAIAGVIMVVVFLAVPALQRNSRNNEYKTEAGRILAATSEFISNNNGTMPSGAANATTILTSAGTPKNITALTITAALTAVTPGLQAATLVTGASCPTTLSGASVTPVSSGSTRTFVVIFAIEGGGNSNNLAQCQNG